MKQCNSCGEEINPKRLKLVPGTQYCVECVEAGVANDVFRYKSTQVVDDYGNFHTGVVKDSKQWKSLNDDNFGIVESLKRVPGDLTSR